MEASEVMPEKEQITAAVAQATLERDRQYRVAQCAQRIQEALQEWGCQLAGAFVWEGGQGRVDIRVVGR